MIQFENQTGDLNKVQRFRKVNGENVSSLKLKDTWACLTLRSQCKS